MHALVLLIAIVNANLIALVVILFIRFSETKVGSEIIVWSVIFILCFFISTYSYQVHQEFLDRSLPLKSNGLWDSFRFYGSNVFGQYPVDLISTVLKNPLPANAIAYTYKNIFSISKGSLYSLIFYCSAAFCFQVIEMLVRKIGHSYAFISVTKKYPSKFELHLLRLSGEIKPILSLYEKNPVKFFLCFSLEFICRSIAIFIFLSLGFTMIDFLFLSW